MAEATWIHRRTTGASAAAERAVVDDSPRPCSGAHRLAALGEGVAQDAQRPRTEPVELEQLRLAALCDLVEAGDADRRQGPRRRRADLGQIRIRHGDIVARACVDGSTGGLVAGNVLGSLSGSRRGSGR